MNRTCVVCGKSYQVTNGNMRKTCSKECEYAARSRASRGRQLKSLQLDLTGQTFGELTVLERVGTGKERDKWLFRCSCGKTIVRDMRTVKYHTKLGKVVSCGHIKNNLAAQRIAEWRGRNAQDGSNVEILRSRSSGRVNKNSSTGVNGVRVKHNVGADSFAARITVAGKTIYLGSFPTLEEAAFARKEAERKYWQPIIDAHDFDHPNK